jgi:decaprenylphospho-beta-D-ribofuranose 2-oxidase
MHPLDFIQNWNYIYGKHGFIQYQIQIPFGKEEFLNEVIIQMKINKVASFLSVLKKFGNSDYSYIGFPSPGWTLAIDIPAKHKNIVKVLNELNEKLCEIGGKVYLSKDSMLTVESFNKMYPNSIRWKKIKNDLDPINYWRSDQGVRLGLC